VSQVQQTEPAIEVLVPLEGETERIEGRTPWQLFWTRFKRDRVAVTAGIVIIILVSMALLAPVFAKFIVHHGPGDQATNLTNDIGVPNVGPSKAYWFGVDKLGQDVFIRTLYGARTSLTVAFLGTGISLIVGIAMGLIAGFRGGKIDTFISRVIDVVLSLPILLLAIGIGAACGTSVTGCAGGLIKPGVPLVTGIIVLFGWPYVARIVRGQTLSLREREFVEAARATGYGNTYIMFREILPNMVASIIVVATLLIPQNILFEAALSFLGVGIPPETPSWGGMINAGVSGNLYKLAPWTLIFPGLFLVTTTLTFNLLGDGLRDALDPRSGR
jgi:peptide/nickel transport system permease protein